MERRSEAIYKLIGVGDKTKKDKLVLNFLANDITINFYVFTSLMKGEIVG